MSYQVELVREQEYQKRITDLMVQRHELGMKLKVAEDALLLADRYFKAKDGVYFCDVGLAEKAAKYGVDKALTTIQINVNKSENVTVIGKGHMSDCALHSGPALTPKPCDCGVQPGLTPEEYGSEFPKKDSSD